MIKTNPPYLQYKCSALLKCAIYTVSLVFLLPGFVFALGGLDEKTSTTMLIAFFLFFTIGAFVMAGAKAGGIMLLFFSILFVVNGLMEGGIRIKMTGIPLDLAIGIVASIIAGIILMLLKR